MKKQKAINLFLILAMAMTLSACGKETDTEEPATVGSIIDIEDIREEIPTEDVEEKDALETEVSTETETENTQSVKEIVAETSMNEQSTEIVEEPSEEQQADEQPTEQPVEQAQEPIEQSVPTATLNGHIDSVGNGEFVIRKSNVISSDVIVSSGEDAEKVSVIYKDSTEFVLCSTSDGGITTDYSTASSSNLCNDRMVEIDGFYEGNYFLAQKVTIYNFQ